MIAPVQTKTDVFTLLAANGDQIAQFGVNRIGLFGSFVRDEQGSHSDVDVLVEFWPAKKTFDNFMQLAALLERLLGRRVELVTTDALSPYIGPHILEEVEYVSLSS